MLTEIRFNAPGMTAIVIPLRSRGPYTVHFIDGLGPVSANIPITSYALSDGLSLGVPRVGKRNVVLTLGLRPSRQSGKSVADVREELLAQAFPGGRIFMTFMRGTKPALFWEGMVESADPPLFVEDPAIQISILGQPYFYGPEIVHEFTVLDGSPQPIEYGGSVPTGFFLRAFAKSNNYPAVRRVRTDKGGSISWGYSNYGGWAMTMDSRFGSKSIYGGVVAQQNVLGTIDEGSSWPELKTGLNNVSVSGLDPSKVGQYDVQIKYRARFRSV